MPLSTWFSATLDVEWFEEKADERDLQEKVPLAAVLFCFVFVFFAPVANHRQVSSREDCKNPEQSSIMEAKDIFIYFCLPKDNFLEKEMAIHSSTIGWKIPWTEEPGRLQSMGTQRVGHDWAISLSLSRTMSGMIQETRDQFQSLV